jgi:hypothetical protein
MKNNYKTRLKTFCNECEMGEARLVYQKKFAKDLKKLLEENEGLRNWVREEGERNSICTYDILGDKVCSDCGCHRKNKNL